MTNVPPAARVPRRKESQDRRKEIVVAASSIAASEGLGRITARHVAARVGVQGGLITHYFTPIDQLVAEAFTYLAEIDRAAIFSSAVGGTATPRMSAILSAYLAPSRDAARLLWLDAWRQAADRPLLRAAVVEQMVKDVGALQSEIHRGILSGEFVVNDIRAATSRILALIDGQTGASAVRAAVDDLILDYRAVDQMIVLNTERELGLLPGSLA